MDDLNRKTVAEFRPSDKLLEVLGVCFCIVYPKKSIFLQRFYADRFSHTCLFG